jgi:NAD(P)-dependent dehydrogenase (short-subunit alcohol dehydrogenase family)
LNSDEYQAPPTGGASGIGLALSTHLLCQNYRVFIADRNTTGAARLASQYNTPSKTVVEYCACDTASWESQLSAFQTALRALDGRISCIFPIAGIGEKKWLPFGFESTDAPVDSFTKPDLSVIDVDVSGVLYTVALAVQHFRRQDAVAWGTSSGEPLMRGAVGLVASVCGFYCVPSLPIYTAAKHALIGLTRSYGVLLREEGITINAVAPNVVRTGISEDAFYDAMEKEGLLTPMDGLMRAFDDMLQGGKSGLVYECGPKGDWAIREGATYLDDESGRCCVLLEERAKRLHYGV